MCKHYLPGSRGDQKALDPLKLESQVVVSYPLWVLALETGNCS